MIPSSVNGDSIASSCEFLLSIGLAAYVLKKHSMSRLIVAGDVLFQPFSLLMRLSELRIFSLSKILFGWWLKTQYHVVNLALPASCQCSNHSVFGLSIYGSKPSEPNN